MKYFLLVAFMVPAFVAPWYWPRLMDFTVYSPHGERWANCMYLAGAALPMMVFCVLILAAEWLASRGRPRVSRGVTLDWGDFMALGRRWVIDKVARPMDRSEPALADHVQLAAGEELIRIALGQYVKSAQQMAAVADAFARGRKGPPECRRVSRMTLGRRDFGSLVRGYAIRQTDRCGNRSEVLLEDIGFDAMDAAIAAARLSPAVPQHGGIHVRANKEHQSPPRADADEEEDRRAEAD